MNAAHRNCTEPEALAKLPLAVRRHRWPPFAGPVGLALSFGTDALRSYSLMAGTGQGTAKKFTRPKPRSPIAIDLATHSSRKRTSFRSFTPPALCNAGHCGLARPANHEFGAVAAHHDPTPHDQVHRNHLTLSRNSNSFLLGLVARASCVLRLASRCSHQPNLPWRKPEMK